MRVKKQQRHRIHCNRNTLYLKIKSKIFTLQCFFPVYEINSVSVSVVVRVQERVILLPVVTRVRRLVPETAVSLSPASRVVRPVSSTDSPSADSRTRTCPVDHSRITTSPATVTCHCCLFFFLSFCLHRLCANYGLICYSNMIVSTRITSL
jgi:hypothetical protein